MHIRLVPIDTRLGEHSLETIASKIEEGLAFSPITIELCKPLELHGAYYPHPTSAELYRIFLSDRYPRHTLALTSRSIGEDLSNNRQPKIYCGWSWIAEGYAIAKTRSGFTRDEKNTDLAHTAIHEILHWANIQHHRKPTWIDRELCLMMPETQPHNTHDVPCDTCQYRFNDFARSRRRRKT